MCPGKKDCVKVTNKTGTKEKVQKQLLLAKIYVQFKNQTNEKIGFSTFCVLRPKWCITVGASRTHSVCAFVQNIKMLSSLLLLLTKIVLP